MKITEELSAEFHRWYLEGKFDAFLRGGLDMEINWEPKVM
jgi:hypothetical protein